MPVTLLERKLVCLRILKMQVWLERYLFKLKVVFSTFMKCLRIQAQGEIYIGQWNNEGPSQTQWDSKGERQCIEVNKVGL